MHLAHLIRNNFALFIMTVLVGLGVAAEPLSALPSLGAVGGPSYRDAGIAYYRECLGGFYQTHSDPKDPNRDAILRLLDVKAIAQFTDWDSSLTKACNEQTSALLARGATNSILRSFNASYLLQAGNAAESLRLTRELIPTLLAESQPPLILYFSRMRYLTACRTLRQDLDEVAVTGFIDSIFALMRKPPESPAVKAYLLNWWLEYVKTDGPNKGIVRDTCLREFERAAKDGSVRGDMLPAMLGAAEIEIAWDLRGGGWGNSVTQDGGKGFEEHLKKARVWLEKAYAIDPKNPFTCSRMGLVCRGQSGDLKEEWTWFERGVSGVPDFIWTWTTLMTSREPRWGGTREEMMKIGRLALESKRYDTEVPLYFLTSIRMVLSDLHTMKEKPDAFLKTQGLWQQVQAVFAAYDKQPGRDPLLRKRDNADYTAWAIRFGETALALQMIKAKSLEGASDARFDDICHRNIDSIMNWAATAGEIPAEKINAKSNF